MWLRILKKDLKRKKTMNVILLLFVVICSMFAAASVNNIITVTGGIDSYLDKAGMSDYFVAVNGKENFEEADRILSGSGNAKSFRKEAALFIASDDLVRENGKKIDLTGAVMVHDIADTAINFFDEDDNVLKDIKKGKMYITGSSARAAKIKAGDKFTLSVGDTSLELEVEGLGKDALLGSPMAGNSRILLSSEDFDKLKSDENSFNEKTGAIFYVDTDDTDGLESDISSIPGVLIKGDRGLIKTSYIMSMMIAVIVLVVSVGLLLVSFVVLRFMIKFTISEEFREIGVMKAIGLRNSSIRMLYLVKYLGISLVGAAIGFAGSIPFGRILVKSASGDIVLGNDGTVLISILCCIGVVLVIMLFCWGSTRKVKKLSPIDAVRNGQTGERFSRRGSFSLGKSRLGSTGFLAVNDVVSEKKQYGIITAIFTLCTLIVMVLGVTVNTLDGGGFRYLLSVTESDAYYTDLVSVMDIMGGRETIKNATEKIEKTLEENNMHGNAFIECWYVLPIRANGKSYQISFIHCSETKASDYEYMEGSAPAKADEIAVTPQISEKIGAGIGDHIMIDIDGKESEYIITAIFESFDNLGEIARLHESVELPDNLVTNTFPFQIDFDDEPDKKVTEERIEKLRTVFGTDKVMDTPAFVDDCMGVADILRPVRNFTFALALIVVVLIAVLMERSFISKEKSEIALMKAVGFKNKSVMLHHTIRFGIAMLAAIIIACVAVVPLTGLVIDPVFRIAGARGSIDYEINAAEVFGLYPAIILAVTILSAAFTALCTKMIKASDTASIE